MNRLDGEKTGNDRAKGGRFAPGNPGSPGRPRHEAERDYLRVMTEAVPWSSSHVPCTAGKGQQSAAVMHGIAPAMIGTPYPCRVLTLSLSGANPIPVGC